MYAHECLRVFMCECKGARSPAVQQQLALQKPPFQKFDVN